MNRSDQIGLGQQRGQSIREQVPGRSVPSRIEGRSERQQLALTQSFISFLGSEQRAQQVVLGPVSPLLHLLAQGSREFPLPPRWLH